MDSAGDSSAGGNGGAGCSGCYAGDITLGGRV